MDQANTEKLRMFIGQIARMETDAELSERLGAKACMNGDDAAATLSRLIEDAREVLRSVFTPSVRAADKSNETSV